MSDKETFQPAVRVEYVGINKEYLRDAALALEEQLRIDSKTSKDVADFASYPPLISAIQRAKALLIEEPEELPGMRYWLFETELPAPEYRKLSDLRANFSLLLKGWHVSEPS